MLREAKPGYLRLKDIHLNLGRSLHRREWRRAVIISLRGRHVNGLEDQNARRSIAAGSPRFRYAAECPRALTQRSAGCAKNRLRRGVGIARLFMDYG